MRAIDTLGLPACHCGEPILGHRDAGDGVWLSHHGHRIFLVDFQLRDRRNVLIRLETFLRDAHTGPFQVRGH